MAIALGPSLAACGTQNSTDGSSATIQAGLERDKNNKVDSVFDFVEIEHGFGEDHLVAPDHQAQVLIRWGDPLFSDAPEFDIDAQTAEKQLRQFGYNCDYVGYLALPPNKEYSKRALLCVNHEYPIHRLMFKNLGKDGRGPLTEEQLKISLASVGASVVEVANVKGEWRVVQDSQYNRRLSALDTEFEVTGPLAGHDRMKTSADPSGRKVIGTFNNCAGGMTPWGTYLTCEENFSYHFSGKLAKGHSEQQNHQRYNVPVDLFKWSKLDQRFDIGKEPNEPNRFGWVVEIDPLDPTSIPKKRTAMGRFKHEGAENVIAPDGRLVVYMGDDQRFEYLYKFVSRDAVDLENRQSNLNLLDNGTLFVARFFADGKVSWLPLSYENEALKAEFESQAEILLEPRRAADILQATPLDRPEDVVPNHRNGSVYVMLTNNTRRTEPNVANPRIENTFGHIIEISEDQENFAGESGSWEILVKCGDPSKPEHQADWNSQTSKNGWFASPDNASLDPQGRLWVSSDQSEKALISGTADGLWSLDTQGDSRGTGKMFYRVPNGAELCGPVFSDDGESLFMAIQHPGEFAGPERALVKKPSTRWPDFDDNLPPRPSVVVVTKKGGGKLA